MGLPLCGSIDNLNKICGKLEKYSQLGDDDKVLSYLRKLKFVDVPMSVLEKTRAFRVLEVVRSCGGVVGMKAEQLLTKWENLEDPVDESSDEEVVKKETPVRSAWTDVDIFASVPSSSGAGAKSKRGKGAVKEGDRQVSRFPPVELGPMDIEVEEGGYFSAHRAKPLPNMCPVKQQVASEVPQKGMSEEEALSWAMSNKAKKTKIYSGSKVANLHNTASEFEIMFTRLMHGDVKDLHRVPELVGLSFGSVRDLLTRCTADQLFALEDINPSWIEHSCGLWKQLVNRDFKIEKRHEMETWRDMYTRCVEEREAKFQRLARSLQKTVSKDRSSVKKIKMAYVEGMDRAVMIGNSSRRSVEPLPVAQYKAPTSYSKPPDSSDDDEPLPELEYAPSTPSVTARVSKYEVSESVVHRMPRPRPVPPKTPTIGRKDKKKIAPLMAKSLQQMKRRYK